MSKIGYFEIFVDDFSRAQTFYENVFGWKFQKAGFPFEYYMIHLPGNEPMGLNLGGMTKRKEMIGNGKQAATVCHIMVEELDEALQKITDNGGKLTGEKMRIPAGLFAYVTDTEGNTIGVWEPAQPK